MASACPPDLVDLRAMRQAIQLALRGLGRTSPNPPVGAVVVRDGQVVGQGHHTRAGEPHAEVVALDLAGEAAREATLYVSLEPCCHEGRTPPCTRRIVASGVRRVVFGVRDPNPVVSGRGAGELVEAGLRVDEGLLEHEAQRLIEPFSRFIRYGIPYVTLKLAISLDGKIAAADGTSRWITGEAAREKAHRLRDRADAILVGIETVLADNPSLTTRLRGQVDCHDPIRVVLDSRLRTPLDAQVLTVSSTSKTWIVTSTASDRARIEELGARGAEVIAVETPAGRIDLPGLLRILAQRGIVHLVVEGGRTVATSFLRERLVDRAMLFIAPIILGGPVNPSFAGDLGIATLDGALKLQRVRCQKLGPDTLIEGLLH